MKDFVDIENLNLIIVEASGWTLRSESSNGSSTRLYVSYLIVFSHSHPLEVVVILHSSFFAVFLVDGSFDQIKVVLLGLNASWNVVQHHEGFGAVRAAARVLLPKVKLVNRASARSMVELGHDLRVAHLESIVRSHHHRFLGLLFLLERLSSPVVEGAEALTALVPGLGCTAKVEFLASTDDIAVFADQLQRGHHFHIF